MGLQVQKWRPIGRNPLDANGVIQVKSHGVEFRNAGDVTIIINGFWVLKPNEPKYFGWDALGLVLEEEFRIEFKEGETGVKRLEIAEMIVKNFDYDSI